MTNEPSEEALKAAASLEMISVVESTEYHDASIMTDKKKKKKEKKRMKKEKKRKVLMANESSSSSQHQQEEKGHERQQEKRKAASLEPSVATGEELERKKKIKLVFKSSPPSSSQQQEQQQQQPQQWQRETASLTQENETEIWRKTASLKGMLEPELYISKTVTTTDTKRDQNRYEISVDNMANKMALQELAIRLNSKPSVNTMVMDKKGREYQVFFKYIPSNCRYRFNGTEFGNFIKDNDLTAGQVMRIYGLRDGTGGNCGFAFINTDT